MKRQLYPEMEQDFFDVHASIVHGAIHKCGLTRKHPEYEDIVQIGLLKLVDAYEEFPEGLMEEEAFYRFTGYAYRKVRWAVLDEMRKVFRIDKQEYALPDNVEEWVRETSIEEVDQIVLSETISDMLEQLDEKEKSILSDFILQNKTVTEVAAAQGVSRKTVYKWKHTIAEKLVSFKPLLKNR